MYFLGSLVAVLLALLAAAPGHTLTVGGQRAIVERPAHPNGTLVLYVHGAGGDATAITNPSYSPPLHRLVGTLLRHGYTVASDDAHGPENWGNPASVRDYVRLVHRLGFRHVVILAESMGGLDGVQLIDHIHPDAFAALFPVCNLRSLEENPLLAPESSAIYRAAWNGQPPPASLSPVKARDVTGLRVILWASPEDRIVPKRENADVCAAEFRRGGANVTEIATAGEHGDASNFQPHRLLRFLQGTG
jgi:pimeloyl-ACP methyl ester carboxylesterase